jgi:Ca-activated chloride channel family protein
MLMRIRRCHPRAVGAAAAAAAAVALAVTLSAQQAQEPVFRTGTRTVPVYVTVTDADGRLVPDLGQDDFEILDNGKPQTISIFANDIQPIMVVMMLDRSGSMVDNFRRVQEAAEQFVTRLLPADKARIGSFSYRVQVDPRTFTNDRDELLRILYKELQEPGPTPLWNAVSVGMTGLLHQEGRRVVLVFTDGADRPGNDRATNITLGDLMKRAREEDVMVYGVGLAGRMPMGGMGRRGGGYGGGGRYPPPPGGWSAAGRTQKPDEGLSKLAAESGGGYFELESTDDLGSTFARVADELHRQYAMGFSPEKLDGKTHKLEVRVKKPGMTARARKSYVATPPRTG